MTVDPGELVRPLRIQLANVRFKLRVQNSSHRTNHAVSAIHFHEFLNWDSPHRTGQLAGTRRGRALRCTVAIEDRADPPDPLIQNHSISVTYTGRDRQTQRPQFQEAADMTTATILLAPTQI